MALDCISALDPASVVIELQAGGRWDLDMVDNTTGERFPVKTVLTRVEPPEYPEGAMSGAGGQIGATLRLWFHDHGDRTRLTLHQGPFPVDQMRTQTSDGWEQSFLKIERALQGENR